MDDLLAIASVQGATFGIAALGIVVAFRVLRYPDLTGDGSFMLGATVFAAGVADRLGWIVPLMAATLIGALAGLVTAQINARLGVSRLLSGIITTMIAYSLAFRMLNGRSNVGLLGETTMFSISIPALAVATIFAASALLAMRSILGSELGILLRATGEQELLVESLNRSPVIYRSIGLGLANGLIGMSGALVAGQQGFADVNMGMGTIITLVASLVLGEQALQILRLGRLGLWGLVAAPFVGATLYFALYLSTLRLSLVDWLPFTILPTDLKMLAALAIIVVVALRPRDQREAVLPL